MDDHKALLADVFEETDNHQWRASEAFLSHARHPRNMGVIETPDGYGHETGQCGDSIELSLCIENNFIRDIKFAPHGCVFTLVCASAVTDLAKGLNLDQALELEPKDVDTTLGGIPEDHLHCARLAVNTLGTAISDYYAKAVIKTKSAKG